MMKQKRFSDRGVARGRLVIRRFLQQVGPVDAVLDIGCGSGEDLATARQLYPGARLYGFDMDTSRAATLEKIGVHSYIINAEKESFPLSDESVDVVMSNQFLEHTRELFWILHESSRVLKTGGYLMIGVPNLASLHNRFLLMLGFQPTSINNYSEHIRGYTKRDVTALINNGFPGGYLLKNFKGSGFYPFPRKIADVLSAALPSMAVRMFLIFRKTTEYNQQFLDYSTRHLPGMYVFP